MTIQEYVETMEKVGGAYLYSHDSVADLIRRVIEDCARTAESGRVANPNWDGDQYNLGREDAAKAIRRLIS